MEKPDIILKGAAVRHLFSAAVVALGLTTAGLAGAKPYLAPSVALPGSADRTIVIKKSTKSVSVAENDTVLFKVGAKQFALKFDGNSAYYDLATLAPPGVLNRRIKVYVSPGSKGHA